MRADRRVSSARVLAGLLGAAGAAHLLLPAPFAGIVPRPLGDPYPWVYGSGALELACAAGLLSDRTRRRAAYATAVLFVAVFPANVAMAVDAVRPEAHRSRGYIALTLLRLPVQVPLVWWALSVARGPSDRRGRRPPPAG